MARVTLETSRISVYPFGARWHWKCGAEPNQPGTCMGGPAHTEEQAHEMGAAHIAEQHTEVWELPVLPDGCRHCGVVAAEHGLRTSEGVGVHEWRPPNAKQASQRWARGRVVQRAGGS